MTDQSSLNSTKLSPHVGAEIYGLSPDDSLTPGTIEALRRVWLESGLLVFRELALSVDRQINFASRFGTPSQTSTKSAHQPDRRVLLISNIRENGKPIGALPDGELQFHSDSAFHEQPLMATLLYSVEVPAAGGDTLFANAAAAYDDLDDALKKRLDGMTALNVYDYSTQVKKTGYDATAGPRAVHPVIRTHPETGRKAIYVNRLMTERITGLEPSESDALLETLFQQIERPAYRYSHKWRPGDLLMWDNRCIQHARTDFPAAERRLLRRIGLNGDKPF